MPHKPKSNPSPFSSSALADSLDMMKNAWSLPGLPSAATSQSAHPLMAGLPASLPPLLSPTLDERELDKRIADLRAIEQWLVFNTHMLRSTIQGLEVQRNTLATLKNFSDALWTKPPAAQPASPATPAQPEAVQAASPAPNAPSEAPSPGPLDAAAAWWQSLQEQFLKVASAAAETSAAPNKVPTRPRKAAKKTSRRSTHKKN